MTNEQVKQLCDGIRHLNLDPASHLDESQKQMWRQGADVMKLAIVQYLHTRMQVTPLGSCCTEKVANWMIKNSFVTGHGDTVEDLLAELVLQAKDRSQL